MKILMIAIPNHHFFQWVNQLKGLEYEVYWFNSTDGGSKVDRIDWVHQIKGWKLKYDYPFRYFIKNKFPLIYQNIQFYNERKITTVFEKVVNDIQPDIIHCFEMQLAGLPVLEVIEQRVNLKFIYSSWGNDVYFYKELGVPEEQFKKFLKRVDYLITDCKRDYEIINQNDFRGKFLGVYPGNGGINIEEKYIQAIKERNVLIIKGYEDRLGKALKVIEAIELVPFELLKNLQIIIYSADISVKERVEKSDFFKSLKVEIYEREVFIANADLLQLMGRSILHIANNISDGMPNVLLEAMGMGAFPIQSNPGKATEEVIAHGVNGLLIENPFDSLEIAKNIEWAILNPAVRAQAQKHNVDFVAKNYNREYLKAGIVQLYKDIIS
ncbi:glycosyltransferase family 4 protein [Flavobacterium acetivorans]|uniref:glycosyltransferase family 4 protein n=1 Tax=Flavobacterium acetivorans TaxID=2893883 RepID=UPI001E2CED04|nr:glycosyltransferase family 4 protein [Flavobacterium sp. F-29]UFH35711.1 glycosyltransferase family 4 protein [Flavobacterium sp. F-29]